EKAGNAVAAGHGGVEVSDVSEIADECLGVLAQGMFRGGGGTDVRRHLDAALAQLGDEHGTHRARGAGDEDPHGGRSISLTCPGASPRRRLPAMGKARLEAFSDGVIAILITIMVLELKIPHGDSMAALAPVLP